MQITTQIWPTGQNCTSDQGFFRMIMYKIKVYHIPFLILLVDVLIPFYTSCTLQSWWCPLRGWI